MAEKTYSLEKKSATGRNAKKNSCNEPSFGLLTYMAWHDKSVKNTIIHQPISRNRKGRIWRSQFPKKAVSEQWEKPQSNKEALKIATENRKKYAKSAPLSCIRTSRESWKSTLNKRDSKIKP